MKRKIPLLLVLLMLAACARKADNASPVSPPGIVTLTSPAENAVCVTGTIISDTESSVPFNWIASANTSSYTLVLENLLTSAITSQSTANLQLTINLLRNTPYSWSIISRSTQTSATSQSDTWKFYNAGAGTVTYAPFPAAIVAPVAGQHINAPAGTVNLTWKGSAVSNNISGYDLYFGSNSTPGLLKSGVTDSFLNNVSVKSNTTYYWKVITKDISGNTSDSGTVQFSVN